MGVFSWCLRLVSSAGVFDESLRRVSSTSLFAEDSSSSSRRTQSTLNIVENVRKCLQMFEQQVARMCALQPHAAYVKRKGMPPVRSLTHSTNLVSYEIRLRGSLTRSLSSLFLESLVESLARISCSSCLYESLARFPTIC